MKIYDKSGKFVKIRKSLTPPEKPFKDKKKYNRRKHKKNIEEIWFFFLTLLFVLIFWLRNDLANDLARKRNLKNI